jgi:pyruvate kinase
MGADKLLPLENYKRTKIIATVGPAAASFEMVKELIAAGANGLRLNFGQGTYDNHAQTVAWIRQASRELKKPVAIIQDLQGPKLYLGDFDGIINIQKGQSYRFGYRADWQDSGVIPTQYDLSANVHRGEPLYVHDGRVRLRITSVRDGVVYTEAETSGIIVRHRHLHLPETDFSGSTLTEKDKRDLAWGSQHDIDYVAQSFVHAASDVLALRLVLKNLGSDARIIAKIETKAATEHLEAIMEAADAVLVAQAGLAMEITPESVPIMQRQIIGLGLKCATPTIVASQMLGSLTEAPEPSPAEVADVATAVLVGADGISLSDETANGQYPIEAVRVMKRVVRYAEAQAPVRPLFPDHPADHSRQAAISRAITGLAESIGARAIVAETKSGATALQLAARRPAVPLIAITSDARTAQQLAIVYGTKSYVRALTRLTVSKLTDWLQQSGILMKGDIVVTASGRQPGVVGTTDTIKVRQLD